MPRTQKSLRQQQRELSTEMRARQCTWAQVAAEFRSLYGMNVRVALRVVRDWSQRDAAEQWNRRWPDDSKTFKNFSYWELWPGPTGHAPSLDVLARLAELYECGVADLVSDCADFRTSDHAYRNRPACTDDPAPSARRVDRAGSPGFEAGATGHTHDVDRKNFLQATVRAGMGALAARHCTDYDANDLAAAVAGPTAHYRQLESWIPTRELAPAVESHLRLAHRVVSESIPTPAGYRVLSEAAGLAAWLSVDRCDTSAARQHYRDAARHARHAQHPLLASYMLASYGHFAAEAGNPRLAHSLLSEARREIDGHQVPDAARAWLASLSAIAHAATGARTEALAQLQAAEKLSQQEHGEPRWPWLFAFDSAKAARYQASTLALLDDPAGAGTAYAAAAPALSAPKTRALAQADHAAMLARTGHADEACALALDALTTAREFDSERITNHVQQLRSTLPDKCSAARELDQQLAALYTEDR